MSQLTILCLASYFKGNPLLRALHAENCRVILIADEHYQHADWAREAINEFYPFPSSTASRTLFTP